MTEKYTGDDIIANVSDAMKRQVDKDYRLCAMNPNTQTRRRLQGYEPVTASDPEIKGTILEKGLNPTSNVQVGGLTLMRISKDRLKVIRDERVKRSRSAEEAIERQYLEAGEDIKRQLGPAHKTFKPFVEKSTDKE